MTFLIRITSVRFLKNPELSDENNVVFNVVVYEYICCTNILYTGLLPHPSLVNLINKYREGLGA